MPVGPVIDSEGMAVWGAGPYVGKVQLADTDSTAWSDAHSVGPWCVCTNIIRNPLVKATFGGDDYTEFCDPLNCVGQFGGAIKPVRSLDGQSLCLRYTGSCECTCTLYGTLDGGGVLRYDFGADCSGTPCLLGLGISVEAENNGTVTTTYPATLEVTDATTSPPTYRFRAWRHFTFTSGDALVGAFLIIRALVFDTGDFQWDYASDTTLDNTLSSTQDCERGTLVNCADLFGGTFATGAYGGTVTLSPMSCDVRDPCASVSGDATNPDPCDLTGTPTDGDGSGADGTPGAPGGPGGVGGPGGPRYPPTDDESCAYRFLSEYDCDAAAYSTPVSAGYAHDRDASDWTYVRSYTSGGKRKCLYEKWVTNDDTDNPCPDIDPADVPDKPTADPDPACCGAGSKKLFACDPADPTGTGTDSGYSLPLSTIISEGLAGKVLETADGRCLRVTAADAGDTATPLDVGYEAVADCSHCFYVHAIPCPGQTGTESSLYVRASSVAAGAALGHDTIVYGGKCYHFTGSDVLLAPSALPDGSVRTDAVPGQSSCTACCLESGHEPTDGTWDHLGSPEVLTFNGSPATGRFVGCEGATLDLGTVNLEWTSSEGDWQSADGSIYIIFVDGGGGGAPSYWKLFIGDPFSSPGVVWTGVKGGDKTGVYQRVCEQSCPPNDDVPTVTVAAGAP